MVNKVTNSKKLGFLFLIVFMTCSFMGSGFSPLMGEPLNEEQMTAYRTRPAVVLIYSGMSVKVALNNGQTFDVPNYGSGSGFFVNPNGYLVTNGHVVDTFQKYTRDKDAYAQKVMNNFIVNRIIMDYKQKHGREPGQKELNTEYMKFTKRFEPRIANHSGINYVLLSNSKYFRFEVKKFSPSIPEGGKDIAVLKIERTNCPVIMLGDSSKLALQQPVFTIGFPAVVDPQRFPLLGKENTLTASITRGSISALKRDYKGMSVIQHDSATSPGNSGGPTVDIKGRVIGVHSYAAREYDGFKFCVPIDTAKEFIRETGIETNVMSDFSTVFNKLMDSVWNEDWFGAHSHVSTALAYMENEPDLKTLQTMILRKISEMGFFEKIWRQNKIIVIIAAVLVVLILVVLKMVFASSGSEPTPQAKPADVPKGEPTASPDPAPAHSPPAQKGQETVDQDPNGTRLEEASSGTVTVILSGESTGSFAVKPGGAIVGRDPALVDILVRSDIVSKTHLKIIPQDNTFKLVDLGSTNGTYVNGEKISEATVATSDQVQLGKKGEVKLVFN